MIIKVRESKESPVMLVKVDNPASVTIDVKHNSAKVLIGNATVVDIINNDNGDHYDVIDADFISYDVADELESFYIYNVIEVKV